MAIRGCFNGEIFDFESVPERDYCEDFTPMDAWAKSPPRQEARVEMQVLAPQIRMLPAMPPRERHTAPVPKPQPKKTNVLRFPSPRVEARVEVGTPRGFRSYALGPAMTLIVKGLQQVEANAGPQDWRRLHESVAQARFLLSSLERKIEESDQE